MSVRRLIATACAVCVLVAGFATSLGADDGNKQSVTVSFGAGLNTAQPGNHANHHIIPQTIKVKAGGVVNFAVAGFHWIFVYQPGKKAADVVLTGGTPLFINDMTDLYYGGLDPTAPPSATPAGFSSTQNRIESVSFSEPGTYLVICNVRPHFADGMYAYIQVEKGGND